MIPNGKKSRPLDANKGMRTSIRHEQLEAKDVVLWRQRQLREAGFDDALASTLAHDCRLDLHALIELVERGCPPELAARILAPFGDEGRPC
jgi:hypothetical protein